jgi:inner membrane protein
MLNALSQWDWLALAVILLIAEVLVSGGFLLWIGISAALVGVLVWIYPLVITWGIQMLLFSALAIISSICWWAYLKRNPIATDEPFLNLRSNQYIGRVFELSEPIINGRGKIKSGDSYWTVTGPDLPVGSKVKVIAADGVVLKVEAFIDKAK